MAKRPWVTPKEVKDYTDIDQVASRDDTKLTIDIQKAESWVITYTNNDFTGEEYEEIPEDVKTAVILLAEVYAANAVKTAKAGGSKVTSETFDDYSYSGAALSETDLGVEVFLDKYKKQKPKGAITMRLRAL